MYCKGLLVVEKCLLFKQSLDKVTLYIMMFRFLTHITQNAFSHLSARR